MKNLTYDKSPIGQNSTPLLRVSKMFYFEAIRILPSLHISNTISLHHLTFASCLLAYRLWDKNMHKNVCYIIQWRSQTFIFLCTRNLITSVCCQSSWGYRLKIDSFKERSGRETGGNFSDIYREGFSNHQGQHRRKTEAVSLKNQTKCNGGCDPCLTTRPSWSLT